MTSQWSALLSSLMQTTSDVLERDEKTPCGVDFFGALLVRVSRMYVGVGDVDHCCGGGWGSFSVVYRLFMYLVYITVKYGS